MAESTVPLLLGGVFVVGALGIGTYLYLNADETATETATETVSTITNTFPCDSTTVSSWKDGVCDTATGKQINTRLPKFDEYNTLTATAKKAWETTCPLFKTETCMVNCILSDWADVLNGTADTCDKKCGGGTKKQYRSILTPASGGGTVCGDLSRTTTCNTEACPIHCEYTEWKNDDMCSVQTTGGTTICYQRRTRSIKTPAGVGGTPCNGLVQDTVDCSVNNCLIAKAMDYADTYYNAQQIFDMSTQTKVELMIIMLQNVKDYITSDNSSINLSKNILFKIYNKYYLTIDFNIYNNTYYKDYYIYHTIITRFPIKYSEWTYDTFFLESMCTYNSPHNYIYTLPILFLYTYFTKINNNNNNLLFTDLLNINLINTTWQNINSSPSSKTTIIDNAIFKSDKILENYFSIEIIALLEELSNFIFNYERYISSRTLYLYNKFRSKIDIIDILDIYINNIKKDSNITNTDNYNYKYLMLYNMFVVLYNNTFSIDANYIETLPKYKEILRIINSQQKPVKYYDNLLNNNVDNININKLNELLSALLSQNS
jgi:hypothetical protein